MMSKYSLRATLGATVATAALVLSACSGSDEKTSNPSSGASGESSAATTSTGGTFRMGYDLGGTAIPVTLDPIETGGSGLTVNAPWMLAIYGSLYRYNAEDELVPDLASSAKVVNPKTLSIELRPNQVFSDGTPFDAKAVKAGIERNKDSDNQRFAEALRKITSIEVKSPTSLVIHLSEPLAGRMFELLASKETLIVAPGAKSPGKNPIGAGPYVLKSYERGQQMVLTKNPKYWDAKNVGPDTIEITNVALGPQRVNVMQSGSIDYTSIDLSGVKTIKANPDLEALVEPTTIQAVYAALCTSYEPLSKVKVRQALNYAIDRKKIINSLLDKLGEPAWSIFPEENRLFPEQLSGKYAYDMDKARQLLREAGYPNGFKIKFIPLPGSALSDQVTQVLQQDWKKLGIDATIKKSTNYVEDYWIKHIGQASVLPNYGLTGLAKLDHYTPSQIGCQYSNPTINKLAAQLKAVQPGTPEAKRLWEQVQVQIVDQAVYLWMAYYPYTAAISDKVTHIDLLTAYGNTVPDYHTLRVAS